MVPAHVMVIFTLKPRYKKRDYSSYNVILSVDTHAYNSTNISIAGLACLPGSSAWTLRPACCACMQSDSSVQGSVVLSRSRRKDSQPTVFLQTLSHACLVRREDMFATPCVPRIVSTGNDKWYVCRKSAVSKLCPTRPSLSLLIRPKLLCQYVSHRPGGQTLRSYV